MSIFHYAAKTTLVTTLGHLAVLLCSWNGGRDGSSHLMIAAAMTPPNFGAVTMKSRSPDVAALSELMALGDSHDVVMTMRGGGPVVIRNRRYRPVDLGALAICVVLVPTVTIPIIRLAATVVVTIVVVNALTGHGFVLVR